ncbi:MAG TPA: choice-of-anchor D domain-containing protein, partial [Candidatus Kapabacteria bacterium]|nr:choice-of-anchor D domain-containing protein [Candidatus Kapabacteria bacterium]
TLLGNITQPLSVAPLRNLNVPFQFHPNAERTYSATLRVWSSAVNDVFIHLKGEGVVPQIKVIPDTIDFHRVRIYHRRDSLFTVSNVGSADLEITDLDFNTSIKDTAFRADTLKGVGGRFTLTPNSSVQDSVHFRPTTEGFSRVSIPIYSTDTVDVPIVILEGTGVEPHVYSENYDFGKFRVDSSSVVRAIPIVNRGSDTTAIDSVTILGGDLADFIVSLDTLPPGPKTAPVALHYPGEGKDTSASFSVQFNPQSLGAKRLIVRIHTVDSAVIKDTLWGVGVEPLVTVQPPVIDFGTIIVQPNLSPPSPMIMNFVVYDSGTMAAHLDSLVSSDDSDFLVRLNTPNDTLNEDLAEHDSLQGTATFFVTGEGDFFDTVFVRNDTRYGLYPYPVNQYVPMIILKASVRTGPVEVQNINFDTIESCVPNTLDLIIHNPYPVEVHIDSMAFQPDSAGFTRVHNFLFPINIPPDGIFQLPVQYIFPPDSLNGSQQDTIVLFQRHGGEEAPMIVEAIAFVYRKERELRLDAVLPAFESSAGDIAPLRLPITIAGPRDSIPELDSYTLTLQFSNDLFVPVGIDTARSLSVPFGAGYSVQTQWGQTTRTYTITVSNAAVSDRTKLANNLLLAILMRAFLTTDTTVTVTPTFTFLHHPCAYNIQPFTLHIPFAEDCGTTTLRAYMFGAMPVVNVIGIRPNPITSHAGVTVTYEARKAAQIIAIVSDANGRELGRTNLSVGIGTGEFTLPDTMLPSSGTAFITLEVSDEMGEAQPRMTLKTSVER